MNACAIGAIALLTIAGVGLAFAAPGCQNQPPAVAEPDRPVIHIRISQSGESLPPLGPTTSATSTASMDPTSGTTVSDTLYDGSQDGIFTEVAEPGTDAALVSGGADSQQGYDVTVPLTPGSGQDGEIPYTVTYADANQLPRFE